MNEVKENMPELQNQSPGKTETTPRLLESWRNRLQEQFSTDHMLKLKKFLQTEIRAGKNIFPRGDQYFAALDACEFENVRVVILGQDPYHGPGQAHGLSFSVPVGVRPPPSLLNIFKELKADVGFEIPDHGNLQTWAERGVLLLNAVLTVEESRAASHQGQGWELFTDAVIRKLNEEREGLVFILWGSYAQKKGAFIDRKKHFVIESVHPSPLSAHRGFLGSKPFSKTNAYLVSQGQAPIDWSLPPRAKLNSGNA